MIEVLQDRVMRTDIVLAGTQIFLTVQHLNSSLRGLIRMNARRS